MSGSCSPNCEEFGMARLAGMRVIIVEDEYFVADRLARNFRQAGATVVGMAPTVQQALSEIRAANAIEGAVLDLNLAGDLVFPVAEELERRNIPFVFYTSYGNAPVPEQFRGVPCVSKPASWDELARAILARQPARRPFLPSQPPWFDVTTLVRRLRIEARTMATSAESADRLVERTLEKALESFLDCPAEQEFESWLIDLMNATSHDEEPPSLH